MTPTDPILFANKAFLDSLQEVDDHTSLSVEASGRIRAVASKAIQTRSLSEAIYKTVKASLQGRLFENAKEIHDYVQHIFNKLSAHGALTASLSSSIKKLEASESNSLLFRRAVIAISTPRHPEYVTDTTSGSSESYYIQDAHGLIGIYKPKEGEQGQPHNVRPHDNFDLMGMGIEPGTQYLREVAASKFAVDLGRIPDTCTFTPPSPVRTHYTVGSLQEFIEGQSYTARYAKTPLGDAFSTVTSDSLFGLILKDLLIGSCDRHLENVIFCGDTLFGIDNGWSFPDALIRPDNPTTSALCHLACAPRCNHPPAQAVVNKFLAINCDEEISSLLNENLINETQATEVRIKYHLLQRLLVSNTNRSPPLSVLDICQYFIPTIASPEPRIVGFARAAWTQLKNRGPLPSPLTKTTLQQFRLAFLSVITREIPIDYTGLVK
jgi:hypothetical protein